MRNRRLEVGQVVIADHGVDACLIERKAQPSVLVLRPDQTFGSAVNAVAALFPHAAMDEVRRLVRQHLPDVMDLDDLIVGVAETHEPKRPRCPYWEIALVLTLAFIGLTAIQLDAKHDDPYDPPAPWSVSSNR